VKILAFDLINTLIDVSQVPKEDLQAYADHLDFFRRTGSYVRWNCPHSIITAPPFRDVVHGLVDAERSGWYLVSMSNMPIKATIRWSGVWRVRFDAIVPLELVKVFKPHPMAYKALRMMFQDDRVVMVTANAMFGDLSGAEVAGMESRLIRHPGCPQTITELVESLR